MTCCLRVRLSLALILSVFLLFPSLVQATEPPSPESLKELLELSGTAKQVREIPALVAM